MSTDIKLSKVQINKIIKEGGNLGKILMSFLPKLIKPDISIGTKHFSSSWIKCSNVSYRCCNSKENKWF